MSARAKPALEHPHIIRLESVDSTQTYAATLAEDGAVDGTTVVAETQTSGRGRRGHVWRDVPGASLLMSVIVRSSLAVTEIPLLSLATSVAVAEALHDVAGIDARLKWPNDVHLGSRKIAGILLERRAGVVLIGIGINVMQRELPDDLAAAATSVALEGGRTDREALLAAVLERAARWRGRLEREGFPAVRTRWSALATTPGRTVSVEGVTGIARGLDEDGALVIETAEGTTRVLAGDVVELA